MLVVVFNPLCPVWFSLLLYCIYFCFSVPNKTISYSQLQKYLARKLLQIDTINPRLNRLLSVYMDIFVTDATQTEAMPNVGEESAP